MSVLHKIGHFQNRRDEVPNQELAAALAKTKDRKGVREIAENLWSDNAQVQSDCLKVLYEIGYLDPALIADYADDFLKLLESKNNRLVWGGMIALSTIAPLKAAEIFKRSEAILRAMERGSVITIDNAVKTLALVAAGDEARRKKLFPILLEHLKKCRPKEIPQHSEKTLPALGLQSQVQLLRERQPRHAQAHALRFMQRDLRQQRNQGVKVLATRNPLLPTRYVGTLKLR